ncbi:MAG TPA: division plane positioning ATPase MipZ [Gaiella sp.]|nr:division plane positioning ATPase MipZ [Gaiella sp.]
MDAFGGQHHPTGLRALRILRQGWWIILLATAAVAGIAYYQSSREQPLYSASSTVLLKYQNLASGLTGIQDLSTVYQDPQRVAQTQTQIAMSPDVAERVVQSAKVPGLTPGAFLGSANVTAATDSDTLLFTNTYTDPETATRLATIHAKEYIQHRRELDTASLVAARKELEGRIEELKSTGFEGSPLVSQLVENEQALRTMEALQTANASLLRPASGAAQIQPRTERAVVLGVVLGLMLGIGLAFARDALDTRVRSSTEIADRLETTLLARLAAPPRRIRRKQRLVMMASPHSAQAEAFRMLRANLEFVNLDRGARSILVTSALEREGKSTTVANLAVALARAGQKVALVDLDLRRPAIGRFFGIPATHPGVTDIVAGGSTLEQALMEVSRDPRRREDAPHVGNGTAATDTGGVLNVLTSGPVPRDPGEVVKDKRLTAMLDQLERSFDFVLVDTPPLLSVGDAMALSAQVDAMITVARLRMLRRGTLDELARSLETCPTIKLGVVVTEAEVDPGYGYGGYAYHSTAKETEWVAVPPSGSAAREETMR